MKHLSITSLQDAVEQLSFQVNANLLTLSSSKTEFLRIGLNQQLAKIHNCTQSVCSLEFILDEHLSCHQISAPSKSCAFYIHEFCCIHPHSNSKTSSIITSTIIYSKLDCCNSL